MPLWPAGHFSRAVALRMIRVIIQSAMIEVGWIFVIGYEDLKETAGHFLRAVAKRMCNFIISSAMTEVGIV
jgi:hypothetical protein